LVYEYKTHEASFQELVEKNQERIHRLLQKEIAAKFRALFVKKAGEKSAPGAALLPAL